MAPAVALPHLKSQLEAEAAAEEGEEEDDDDMASVWDLPRPGAPASFWLPVPVPEVCRLEILGHTCRRGEAGGLVRNAPWRLATLAASSIVRAAWNRCDVCC